MGKLNTGDNIKSSLYFTFLLWSVWLNNFISGSTQKFVAKEMVHNYSFVLSVKQNKLHVYLERVQKHLILR